MVLILVMAYCIGSVPFALLLARGDDVRRIGSGNVGAANVLRASGVRAGVLVAMLDIAKGAASVALAMRLSTDSSVPAAAGFAAIVGHIYPVWLRFQGGKGVATACGVFSVLTPLAALPAFAVFIGDGLDHAVRVPRLGARDDRPAAGGVRDGLSGGDADGRVRGLRAHSLPAPRQPGAAARRHRAATGGASLMAAVAVLGAGSWGTALAVHLARVGHDVRLWARDPAIVDDMAARRANVVYLPDVTLPATIAVTHDLERALDGAALVICAVPSHGCRAVLRQTARHLGPARHDRQRHQGPRSRQPPSRVAGDRRGSGPRPSGGRAVRSEFRDGGRAAAADRRARGIGERAGDRARAERVPRTRSSACTAATTWSAWRSAGR